MGYTKQAFTGIGWMGGLRLASRLLTLLRTAILARLLLPVQFGVYGVITLTIALFEILTETGINTVLIQEEEEIDTFIDTAWLISIFRGLLISLLIILFAPLLAQFFAAPEVRKFLLLASLVPFLRGFINPSIVKFQKKLQFQKEFQLRFTVLLFESFAAIILTLLTRNVTSLVLALVFSAALEVLLSFLFCRPRPHLSWLPDKARQIISRGKWITLSGLFAYAVDQGDDAVVGRLLGMGNLGLYQMAYKISNLPFTEITDVASQVTFPVYAKIYQDKKRVYQAFKKTFLFTALLAVPGTTLIFLFPQAIIAVLLGNQWLGAAPALKILALFGLTRALSGTAQPVLYAFKKQALVAKINLGKLIFLGLLILPLTARYQLVGVSMAVLLSSLLIQPFIWFNLSKVLK